MHNILSTGSKGNAIIYFNSILVDVGISFSRIEPYLKDIQIVLLTHQHSDHFKLNVIKRIQEERPSIRFGCGEFLADKLHGIRNLDIYESGKMYNYGSFKISPVILYHDVPNFGYRIFKDGKKLIHATDTYTLEGISARDYDIYALECNYDEERVFNIIREKEYRGEYAHQKGSINSHLSKQQAQKFILSNTSRQDIQFLMLHQSSEF
ncbi:MBL fold metallo-hydrolase [Dysgonomonas capnocytophagoides]|uniref:MBL fold metallo-hydrolase n=1 Tax=Dysgonomonas capnocytophagoides TaxID=45254 RepID=UPI00041718E9|nr:MBL fold metallo-hydrolase [Dysgonomonas capnocytophagoides]